MSTLLYMSNRFQMVIRSSDD